MSERNLVSVIIPTRNRQIYANAAIRQIMDLNEDIQVVVCDNSDDDSLKKMISDYFTDERLLYKYISERISGIENYETAASLATGKYLCAIGDDDGILPTIIECARWMERNDIDAVKPNKRINYWWPDENRAINDKKRKGALALLGISNLVRRLDTKAAVEELLKNGGQGYLGLDMIGSYHCLVSMNCMKRVKEITGRYYGGLSPDMYSGMPESSSKDKSLSDRDTDFVTGVCPQSTSAQSVDSNHFGKLESAPHLIGRGEYVWDKRIPRIYSVETIWGETLLKAVEAMEKNDLIEKYFSYERLCRFLLINNYSHKDEIIKVLGTDKTIDNIEGEYRNKNKKKNRINQYKDKMEYMVKVLCQRYLRKRPCVSIGEACSSVVNFLHKKKNKAIISEVFNLMV